MRQVNESMTEVLALPYIRTAISAGIRERRVVWRYAFPNAITPVITLIPIMIAGLVSASVVVENVVSIPGLGSAIVDAVTNRDYPALQGIVLLLAVVVIVLNLLADLVVVALNPTTRNGE